MSERAARWFEEWVEENIRTCLAPGGNHADAINALARRLERDAQQAHVGLSELEDAIGNHVDAIVQAYEIANPNQDEA